MYKISIRSVKLSSSSLSHCPHYGPPTKMKQFNAEELPQQVLLSQLILRPLKFLKDLDSSIKMRKIRIQVTRIWRKPLIFLRLKERKGQPVLMEFGCIRLTNF